MRVVIRGAEVATTLCRDYSNRFVAMNTPLDFHTHHTNCIGSGILCVSPCDVAPCVEQSTQVLLSVGIHPWSTENVSEMELKRKLAMLSEVAMLPQVVAIGETGLDSLRGGPIDVQEQLLMAHIAVSERVKKPLVLHVVKQYNRVLELRKRLLPNLSQPWILHGFRGKSQLASQLLASSAPQSKVYISLGAQFNVQTARCIPAESLLVETDESTSLITDIIAQIADARGESASAITAIILQNVQRVIAPGIV